MPRLALAATVLIFIFYGGYAAQTQNSRPLVTAQSPEQAAYERFRAWLTSQPRAGLQAPDLITKYREYLKSKGFSSADIDTQIQVVQQQGQRLEIERWNQILTSEHPRFNTKPNAFLVEMAKDRKPGAALDVGMGQGRNAVWLAEQGWKVTGFDPAEKAVALANEHAKERGVHLTTTVNTMESFDFGEAQWDLIVMSYVGVRGITDEIQKALKPGGILVIEAAHRDATKEHSIGGAVVFDTAELPSLFPNLRVVRYEEPLAIADFGQQRLSRVVRYCAERPETN
ncbi:MAG: class I SAM-dependent methyltransferase [Acidobacteriaceae bacterium]|nr:class I SAM-dependent methyltransferase [Acidobacteriaceae bacterium]